MASYGAQAEDLYRLQAAQLFSISTRLFSSFVVFGSDIKRTESCRIKVVPTEGRGGGVKGGRSWSLPTSHIAISFPTSQVWSSAPGFT